MTDEGASGAQGHTGGCLCGAIRYQTTSPPLGVTHCHCTNCRRATGAPFATFAAFRAGDVAFEGTRPRRFRVTDWAERGFCPTCGGALLFAYDEQPGLVILAVASLDDPEAVTPDSHIWTTSRVAWVRCDDGLPTHLEGRPRKPRPETKP